uniref:Uncharacterized protein n=1 Tax=Tetraselmis sp. GSL018 TaxID=582737 RepID=A0A061SIP2_9CHLO|mmetsp:Transcript_961/g.2288  ORF Transcript_961/g.2288 Transcript_961/m.2288 type:complete len:350 (-) Transcript_961:978-2027(-)
MAPVTEHLECVPLSGPSSPLGQTFWDSLDLKFSVSTNQVKWAADRLLQLRNTIRWSAPEKLNFLSDSASLRLGLADSSFKIYVSKQKLIGVESAVKHSTEIIDMKVENVVYYFLSKPYFSLLSESDCGATFEKLSAPMPPETFLFRMEFGKDLNQLGRNSLEAVFQATVVETEYSRHVAFWTVTPPAYETSPKLKRVQNYVALYSFTEMGDNVHCEHLYLTGRLPYFVGRKPGYVRSFRENMGIHSLQCLAIGLTCSPWVYGQHSPGKLPRAYVTHRAKLLAQWMQRSGLQVSSQGRGKPVQYSFRGQTLEGKLWSDVQSEGNVSVQAKIFFPGVDVCPINLAPRSLRS